MRINFWFGFLILLFITTNAQAGIREVPVGQSVQLAAGEGLLLLSFDSNVNMDSVGITSREGGDGSYVIKRPIADKNIRLLVAKAGKYTWKDVRLAYGTYELQSGDKFTFEVKSGVFNYPGDLIFRQGSNHSRFHLANRGLDYIAWYKKNYPALSMQYDFEYSGEFPDPFPDFLKKENTINVQESKSKPLPTPPKLALPIETLFKLNRIADSWISPDGRYVLEELNTPKFQIVEVVDPISGTITRMGSYYEVLDLQWLSDRTLVLTYGSDGERSGSVFVKLIPQPDGSIHFEHTNIFRNGFVIDPLKNDPENFLYAGDSISNPDRLLVYVLSKQKTELLADRDTFRSQNAKRLKLDNLIHWITNSSGRIVAVVKREIDGKMMFQKRVGNDFVNVKSIAEDGLWPVAISPDGSRVFAISGEDSEQRELVSVNSENLEDAKPVFRMPGKDIVSVVLDANRQPVGASYYRDGTFVTHYFDADSEVLQKRLGITFEDSSIVITDKADNNNKSLVYVENSSKPGSLYLFNRETDQLSNIDDQSPWLDSFHFPKSKIISVKSKDGLQIEAYLMLPSVKPPAQVPLIVVPHGGPIGVRDDRNFDHEAQFLLSLGYAVLKVNYRGSEGFGKAFRAAGKQSLGTKIEDDIETVLLQVLNTEAIDKKRMCILGTSYGGYSALVSVARWPDRYRCAVSISGVSDRILQFTASDGAAIPETKKWMQEYFGDPLTQKEKMISEQPVYLYKNIKAAVMLVHGTEDVRVDYENALRMQRMLTISGNTPVLLTLKNEVHGLNSMRAEKIAWEAIAGFLAENLNPPAPTTAVVSGK